MSVFLDRPESSWVASNTVAFAIRDAHPVSNGHTLVVTRRVVSDWFAATAEERIGILELVDEVKRQLDDELHPDGYNVGFNAGLAAGQTVMHLHVHVIPRFRGDMDDPRGGVRHVIPSKGNYLLDVNRLATGGREDPFARHVLPLFDRATEIAIVAAFVQESGLDVIDDAVRRAVARGACVRIVTGDYLAITQASALERLLDWQRTSAVDDDEEPSQKFFAARVVETTLPGRTQSFHPKAWRFQGERFGVAFVGSSNLSRSALGTGVEWNLRLDRDRDAIAYARTCDAFEGLWSISRPLDQAWVEEYAERARLSARSLPPGEVEAEVLQPLPPAHEVQREALLKLREARAQGRRRALVVLATGLGKTFLAALDYRQLGEELGNRPRLLFIAHRREILHQAATTYRRLLHDLGQQARVTWFRDDQSDLGGDLVFASVAKLARREHVERLRAERFDYVVVDEVHHAAADSYRRILDAIDPHFLLGLTATPDRADTADILGLFDDHTAYRADIGRGVEVGRLTPFRYFGVKDDIDYAQIPWRNKRFDPEALAQAAQTEARMQTMWRAWSAHIGKRTLVFCCSVAHAVYVRAWLGERGVRAAAVFSAEGSDDRDGSLERLEAGDIDALCAVDVFNEGVDVPSVDRVVMLRPTESSVVFLQQLGRGLRAAEGKTALTVIDFVGNDRIFIERVRTLLALTGSKVGQDLRAFLRSTVGEELPAGCSVEIEIEAKAMLERLFRVDGTDQVERAYRELRELRRDRGTGKLERGERPTAGELQRMGYPPGQLQRRHGSWFGFVSSEADLEAEELRAFEAAKAFLRDVESTEMTKCFKMVALEALLEEGSLISGLPLRDLALRSHKLLRRSPDLFADVAEDEQADEITPSREKGWLAYWRKNPIDAWTSPKSDRRTWFRLDGDRFGLDLAIDPTIEPALMRLTRELVDYRMAQYRARSRRAVAFSEGFVCKVIWNQRDPILKLPSRTGTTLPEGETDVRLSDGAVWQFLFKKVACNVARPAGRPRNELPDLLRSWFGPRAGEPGTAFEVRFHSSPDGLWVEPMLAKVIALPPRRAVVAYPELRAAAGHVADAIEQPNEEHAFLPIDITSRELFAVRVSGSSMDGGRAPMRDGDWAVMRLRRGAPAEEVAGRVALVRVPGEAFGTQYQIKRLSRRERGWQLTSDNPDGPTIEPREDMTVIACLERVVRPEDLAPSAGTVLGENELAVGFGLDDLQPRSGRHQGHLFVFIDRKGMLESSDAIRYPALPRRPAETAFALAKQADSRWRFLGVARSDDGVLWRIPDVDHATWRMWGTGREVSRRVPDRALSRAQIAVDALLALPEAERSIEQLTGQRARILGIAERGGLRIDGGAGGFGERTVSLVDIAWVAVADDDVRENGGVLDEPRVNRSRYLEGTPKSSTRWIDTGWAIAAWVSVRDRVRERLAQLDEAELLTRDDGVPIDARFRLEREGEAITVIFESRGGTRGAGDERNADYAEGLELILIRLRNAGIALADAMVDSRETSNLPIEDRRLVVEDAPYPITIADAAELRKKLTGAAAKVGREPGARGSGNRTRRLRLVIKAGGELSSEGQLRSCLRGSGRE